MTRLPLGFRSLITTIVYTASMQINHRTLGVTSPVRTSVRIPVRPYVRTGGRCIGSSGGDPFGYSHMGVCGSRLLLWKTESSERGRRIGESDDYFSSSLRYRS